MQTLNPTAALLVIGNEILSGRTRDENINSCAVRLASHGIDFMEVRVVPDIEDAIVKAINELRTQYTYVFTSGGIGPTHDDITAQSVAKAFGVPIEENATAVELIPNPDHRKMCLMPYGAELITNELTKAPGFSIENVYVTAGVPSIMAAMMDSALKGIPKYAPMLSDYVEIEKPESAIAEALDKIQNDNTDVEIGSYPHFDSKTKKSRGVQIVIRGRDKDRIQSVKTAISALI